MAQQSMFAGGGKKKKKRTKRAPKRGIVTVTIVTIPAHERKIDRDKIKRTASGRFAKKR